MNQRFATVIIYAPAARSAWLLQFAYIVLQSVQCAARFAYQGFSAWLCLLTLSLSLSLFSDRQQRICQFAAMTVNRQNGSERFSYGFGAIGGSGWVPGSHMLDPTKFMGHLEAHSSWRTCPAIAGAASGYAYKTLRQLSQMQMLCCSDALHKGLAKWAWSWLST